MCKVLHAEVGFDRVDLALRTLCEDLVDVCNNGLDVGRAVLRHELPNGLEVAPEVAKRDRCQEPLVENKKPAYVMASTTAEEAYPALNRFGLLEIWSLSKSKR